MTPRAILLHWKQDEIDALVQRLEPSGYLIDPHAPVSGEGSKTLRQAAPPDLLVISLDRLPSHGHAVAEHFQRRKDFRLIPILFVGGTPDKVAKIRAAMPSAWFANWTAAPDIMARIREGETAPPVARPHAPGSAPRQRSMAEKLGLKEGMEVALLGEAPGDLYSCVPGLSFEVSVVEAPRAGSTDLVLWFVRTAEEAAEGFAWLAARCPSKPRIWVFYRRGAGSQGLTWGALSELAAPHELAQFKILRLDETWTGVAFGRARKGGSRP